MADESLFTTQTPTSPNFDATGITVGDAIRFLKDGVVKGIKFYAHTTLSGGTYTGELYLMSTQDSGSDDPGGGTGTLVSGATATFGTLTAGSWNTVLFPTPVNVLKDTVYVMSAYSSVGRYMSSSGVLSSDLTNGNIVGIGHNTTYAGKLVRNGRYNYATGTSYPNDHFSTEMYFVDVIYEASSSGTPFTRDYASTWRVFNGLTRDYISTWRVLNAISRDYASTWRVLNAYTVDYASTWRVLNAYTVDYTSTWRVFNAWLRDYASTWRVLNGWTSDYSSTWRVFNAFARDYASTWDVLSGTAFTRDFTSTWRVTNQFSADYASTWRILGTWARDYSSTWRVLNALTRDYATTWRVYNALTRDYGSTWRVLGGFTRDYTSTWAVLGETPDGLTVQVWSGTSLVPATISVWDGAHEIPAVVESIVP